MFELKQQSRNYRHVGNFPTCRQMSCRLDTLADTTFSCVCDMTEKCRDMSPDTTQNVASWAQKRHADIRHVELSGFWLLRRIGTWITRRIGTRVEAWLLRRIGTWLLRRIGTRVEAWLLRRIGTRVEAWLFLAPHVADVSPTCRRHRQMSPNLGRHCVSLRHRRGPDIPNLCQLQPTSTSQSKHTS